MIKCNTMWPLLYHLFDCFLSYWFRDSSIQCFSRGQRYTNAQGMTHVTIYWRLLFLILHLYIEDSCIIQCCSWGQRPLYPHSSVWHMWLYSSPLSALSIALVYKRWNITRLFVLEARQRKKHSTQLARLACFWALSITFSASLGSILHSVTKNGHKVSNALQLTQLEPN